ncbi:MAG: gliding motility-associated ABC transporter substrate-binding protein GldG [Bacteroidales bacterium]|jgi:ABC-2 type transport system permease protein|nr:gliding motility-associated ABC transporter substrate-binding protein GldG [Bacteroidales bacterium]
MYSLFIKETRQFFLGISGYFILFLFYTVTALVLFVLPNQFQILGSGTASLDGFFSFAPFAFLFLIPAICMKCFSEEKKTGTLEILLTRPLTSYQIVLAKFLSCIIFFAVSILPVFVYYYTVYMLATPVGNIDTSAVIGSLFGLFFLGGAFIAISVFLSSLTDSQVLAFIVSVVCSAFFYLGFDTLSQLAGDGSLSVFLSSLGMKEHFSSLGRGVLDIRDILYFASIIAVFVVFTAEILRAQKRAQKCHQKFVGKPAIKISSIVIFTIVINIIFSFFTIRLDLTADKRYTLNKVTKQLLKKTTKPAYIRVYLTGDLPAGFKRLEKSIKETLDEFSRYNKNLHYQFVDIYSDEKQSREYIRTLVESGFEPTQLEVKTNEGIMRRLIFPYAEVRFGDRYIPVKLLVDQMGRSADETLHSSIENIEMQLIKGIRALTSQYIPSIAFLTGNGELTYTQTESIGNTLSTYYNVRRTSIEDGLFLRDSNGYVRNKYDALIVAHPILTFSQVQKFILDQYVMNGGRIIWFIDPSNAALDSLQKSSQTNAISLSLGLEDMFFRYGFRISNDIILDLDCAFSPVITSSVGGRPQTEFLPNLYRPVLTVFGTLSGFDGERVETSFVASIDTIESSAQKIPFLFTSEYTKKIPIPTVISADIMYDRTNPSSFRQGVLTAGLYLYGKFLSAFSIIRPTIPDSVVMPAYRSFTDSGKMFVFSDGDIIRNEVNRSQNIVYPLGYDPYMRIFFGNEKVVLNAVHTTLNSPELIELGTRAMAMRLLDKTRVGEKKSFYIFLNFGIPYFFMLLFGGFFAWKRKKINNL